MDRYRWNLSARDINTRAPKLTSSLVRPVKSLHKPCSDEPCHNHFIFWRVCYTPWSLARVQQQSLRNRSISVRVPASAKPESYSCISWPGLQLAHPCALQLAQPTRVSPRRLTACQ